MSKSKKFKASKISTVIGHGTEIKGDISFSGGLHLDGVIKGNLATHQDNAATLTVSEDGSIEGDVRVPNVILNGVVVGDIYASGRVELAAKARVTGTVYYNLLEMAMGAEINGQLKHVNESEPRMLGYLDGEKDPDEEGSQ
ncbi:MAG: polymer-forming cytoskeletal protein [Candidatus Polarisedimenticolaceae bacterium]|nr:polymer-forming cytoskeletal protein [Candidatus Polarisedimenticolaceae bacterium]